MSRITIHDVSKAAGVSIKTVSRVLNSEPNVRSETRARVLKLVEELNSRDPFGGAMYARSAQLPPLAPAPESERAPVLLPDPAIARARTTDVAHHRASGTPSGIEE